ncbi:MAG: transglutaminase-like domain-containing protein, partial [Thermacetogeniaceae bacterium]
MQKRALPMLTALLLALLLFSLPAEAAYRTGFKSSNIEVISPSRSGLECEGFLTIEGRTSLERVWFCLRGPSGEIITWPAAAQNGYFRTKAWLRYGPGIYTIWAGDNPRHFDGSIRFEAYNRGREDLRYLSPSPWVDSDNPEVIALANSLIRPEMTERERLLAIHDWVAAQIAYDYAAYLRGESALVPASATLKKRAGLCRDYAFLVAALARALNMPARVIYGEVSEEGARTRIHAWNEVYCEGRWVI